MVVYGVAGNDLCAQTGHMKVVIPPDIMDLDDSADLLTAKENSDLRLRCRATGTPKPVVTWRREDGRNITLRTENGVQRGNVHKKLRSLWGKFV